MADPWDAIVAHFRWLRGRMDGHPIAAAVGGIEQLASFIAEGSLNQALFGWADKFDLRIQQTDTPHAGPSLDVSPLQSGLVEFRYVDTMIVARQWRRTVQPADTVSRLIRFLDQLHWIAGPIEVPSGASAGRF